MSEDVARAQCLANWPDAEAGNYHPSCCRFPKSCSAPEEDTDCRDCAVNGGAHKPDCRTAALAALRDDVQAGVREALERDRLREAVARALRQATGLGSYADWADAVLRLPEMAALLDAAEKVRRVEALFAGGPDTPCRTTWRTEFGHSLPRTECVEVPMNELRDALDGKP